MANRLLTILWPSLLVAFSAHAEPIAARYELVRQVPWSADGLAETIESAGGGMLLTAAPAARTRIVPSVARGADGTLWLFTKKQLGRADEGGFSPVSLSAFGAGVHAVAPVPGGAIVLGSKGRENVLARLGPDGQAAWRKTGPLDPSAADPAALQGVLRRLGVDADGKVYLYATRQAGALATVDPASGAVETALTLADFRSPSAWVLGGVLYRAQPASGAAHTWVARPVAGGADKVIEPEDAIAKALPGATPLPDGGALVIPRASLERMGPGGKAAGTLPLVGIVRGPDGALFVGLRQADTLVVTRWSGGKPEQSVTLGGLPEYARLAAAGPDGFKVISGKTAVKAGSLVEYDAAGKQTASSPLDGKADEVLGFEGRVALIERIVAPDGSIYVPGADARGAYIVRIILP